MTAGENQHTVTAVDVQAALLLALRPDGAYTDDDMLRSMKLLYYAQGINFALCGSLLFADRSFTKARHGPKIDGLNVRQHVGKENSALSAFCTDVVQQFSAFTTDEIVRMTHEEYPYKTTTNVDDVIDNSLLEHYFQNFDANLMSICKARYDNSKKNATEDLAALLNSIFPSAVTDDT